MIRETCMPHGVASEWMATMTGKRGRHHWHQGFGPWAFGGSGSWGGPPWGGPGGPGGPPWARRGPKARRGDIRAAILSVLSDQPMNGYQLIQEIAERSGGVWKPSPGSIYPTLQQLEDEGLVRADTDGGRRIFRLTDEGERYVAEHAEEMAAPWQAMSASAEDDDANGLRPLIGQTASALWQILATGSPEQQARAREILADTRRRLYGILADGDDEGDERDQEDGRP